MFFYIHKQFFSIIFPQKKFECTGMCSWETHSVHKSVFLCSWVQGRCEFLFVCLSAVSVYLFYTIFLLLLLFFLYLHFYICRCFLCTLFAHQLNPPAHIYSELKYSFTTSYFSRIQGHSGHVNDYNGWYCFLG